MDGHRDWIMKAEEYAGDRYGLTLEDLGWEFEDCSVIMENPIAWVDEAFKNYDPSAEDAAEYWGDILERIEGRHRDALNKDLYPDREWDALAKILTEEDDG